MIQRAYIASANIRHPRLRFLWDEWNVENTYRPPRPGDVARLSALSKRANCAFTIAIAEWIVARFDGMDTDPEPAQFLEAAWAANVDLRYCYEIDIVDDEWRGPVRGPISMALTFVSDALFAEEAGPNSSHNPAWAARFARHVLPSSSAFDAWFEFCLARLESLYRAPVAGDLDWFDAQQDWGAPLPAEVFDPDRRYDPANADALIDRFLMQLDPQANEFLATPQAMDDLGFVGVPYRYPAG